MPHPSQKRNLMIDRVRAVEHEVKDISHRLMRMETRLVKLIEALGFPHIVHSAERSKKDRE